MAQWQTTYGGLVALLGDYVEDASDEFVGALPGIVGRAEERILRDLDLLAFNATTSGTTSSGVGTFNKSFANTHIHAIFFTSSKTHPERRTREYVVNHGGSGVPRYFYEDSTKVLWAPTPDDAYAYDITYVVRPTPLSASNQTNWLTTNVSDLLLWAALVESEHFLLAPERVAEFEGKYQQFLGPARALWRPLMQAQYEPINPAPTPVQSR